MPRAEDGGELGSPLLSPTEVMERVLSESIPGQDSHADRLFMLKEFRDSGLIDEAVYREMVKVVRHHLDRPDAAQPAIKSGVHESGERPPLTRDMKYKFGLIFAMNVFMVYSQQVTGPVMVFVYTQFFNEAPHHGHCDTKVQMATTGCVDALATMAKVQAWQNMIQGFLTFIVTPVWGKVSDSFGRRYLLIAALFICLLQLGSLILSQPPFNMSLWIYIGLNTCPGGLYSSVANAFIADIFPAEWRAVAFGLLSATWGVGLATGPLVNLIPFKGYTIPMVVSFASSSCCFLYTCCMIPESLEPKNRVTFECGESLNFVKQASVLWYGPKGLSSKILFRRLAICVCVNAMLLDGIGNVWNLFVRREFEFSRQQNVISVSLARARVRDVPGAALLCWFAVLGFAVLAGRVLRTQQVFLTLHVYICMAARFVRCVCAVARTKQTVTFGVSRVFVLSVLLRPMLDRFGEGGTLIIGLISNLVFTTCEYELRIAPCSLRWGVACLEGHVAISSLNCGVRPQTTAFWCFHWLRKLVLSFPYTSVASSTHLAAWFTPPLRPSRAPSAPPTSKGGSSVH
jgi:MFS family permease